MLGHRSTGGLFAALLSLVGAGCLDELDKPAPPATPANVTGLDAPTGDLGEASFAAVLAGLDAGSDVYASLCGWDPVVDLACLVDGTCPQCEATEVFFDVLRDLLPSLEGDADGGVDDVAGVNGYVELVRICPGFGTPSPDPAHGRILLNVGFTGHGVDPIAWGTVSACQVILGGLPLTIDAEIGFHYEERVPFALLESTPVIFAFSGTVTQGASTLQVELALRLRPDGAGDKELLVDLGDLGTFAFVVGPAGVFVKAADGFFTCNVMTETCSLVSGT